MIYFSKVFDYHDPVVLLQAVKDPNIISLGIPPNLLLDYKNLQILKGALRFAKT